MSQKGFFDFSFFKDYHLNNFGCKKKSVISITTKKVSVTHKVKCEEKFLKLSRKHL